MCSGSWICAARQHVPTDPHSSFNPFHWPCRHSRERAASAFAQPSYKTVWRDLPAEHVGWAVVVCSHLQTSQLTKHPYTGTKVVHISTQRLLHEVSDEKRFRKTMSTISWQVRNATGDGLFTVSYIPSSPPITYYATDS